MSENITEWAGGDYRIYNEDRKYLRHEFIPAFIERLGQPGPDLVVTIVNITYDTFKSLKKDTPDDKRLTLHFKEDVKPFAIGKKVVPEQIYQALGTRDTSRWIGRRLALYEGEEPRSNDGYAVRVRPYEPKIAEAICTDCGAPITAHGNYTVNKIVIMTENKYGRALCWECAKKAKEEQEEESV